jgi:flavodoxin
MTGNTRRLAQEIQRATGAQIEEIVEVRPRRGFVGMLRAMVDAFTGRMPRLAPVAHDPAALDLLILGGPVWGRRLASPVRAYAAAFAGKAPRMALFCTEGGQGDEAAFADLETLCGRQRVASLGVDAKHLPDEAHREALAKFVARVGLLVDDAGSDLPAATG